MKKNMKYKTKVVLVLLLVLFCVCSGGCRTAPGSEAALPKAEADNEAALPEAQAQDGNEATLPEAQTQSGNVAELQEAHTESGVSIVDMTGREITLDGPAERIVALSAADCEILYAVGAGDQLVGRGEYCDYPAEVLEVPSVQSGYETNLEQIIALEPQVLLMSTMAQTQEQVDALESAGIHVVVSDAADIEGVCESIGIIGELTGHASEAEVVAGQLKTSLAQLSEKAADSGIAGRSVYFEVSPLEYGLWTAGKGTFMDEEAQLLGLENIFADVDGWAEVSEEQVIERNPDYIVTITMYYGEGPTPEEEILSRPGWEDISAVKNASILNLQGEELSRPGPRIADGAQLLYDFVCQH